MKATCFLGFHIVRGWYFREWHGSGFGKNYAGQCRYCDRACFLYNKNEKPTNNLYFGGLLY